MVRLRANVGFVTQRLVGGTVKFFTGGKPGGDAEILDRTAGAGPYKEHAFLIVTVTAEEAKTAGLETSVS
jgi:hypothetical protein